MNLIIRITEEGGLRIGSDHPEMVTRITMLREVAGWFGENDLRGDITWPLHRSKRGESMTVDLSDVPATSDSVCVLLVRHLLDVFPSLDVRIVRVEP